ncbi:MAG: glycosyltransferase [Acidimicrobiales bacterium]
MIAEVGYRAHHPDAVLVRNTVEVPDVVAPTGSDRLVYLGRVSAGRGATVLARVADRMPADTTLDVIGPLDAEIEDVFAGSPRVVARGFVANDRALPAVQGATAGVALLRDLPNYRHSMPTKVLEYLAQGVPVITTPLPAAVEVVEGHDCGVVVPFDDPAAVFDAFAALRADPDERQRLATNGRRAVAEHYNWRDDSRRMLDLCRRLARPAR